MYNIQFYLINNINIKYDIIYVDKLSKIKVTKIHIFKRNSKILHPFHYSVTHNILLRGALKHI